MAKFDQSRLVLAKILGPALISISILVVFFFGGEAYQRFGLEAVDSTSAVMKNVLGVIGFISLAVLANRIIRYVIFDGFIASATGTPVPRLLSQISSLIIYVIAISACARIVFEQDLTFLWAASGVAGLVLGMALRELLQDVFAGIALNIDRATRIGDFIQIHRAGDERTIGQLMEISWRTTRVKDLLGDMISFPNSKFSAFTISNFSLPEAVSSRRVFVTLECSVPADQAFRILQAAALDALIGMVGPNVSVPTVAVNAIRVEGVEYMITFRAEWPHLMPATRAILKSALTHLARAGLRPAGHAIALTDRSTGASAPVVDPQQLMSLLAGLPILARIPTEGLQCLAASARRVSFTPDKVVVQAGEAGGEFHVLLEGLLEAHEAVRLAGQAPTATLLRPGTAFGERTALLGAPHRQTVRARTGALLLEIGGDALQRLFRECPGTLEIVARNLLVLDPHRDGNAEDDPYESLVRHLRLMFPGARTAGAVLRDASRDGL